MKLDRQRVIHIGKRLKDEVSDDDVSGASAELAYRFFLALFPFFVFLAALGGFVASLSGLENPTDEIMDLVGDSLPSDSASVLRSQLESVIESRNAGLMSIGILGAIWAASSGVGALMKNMNRIYDVGESRSLPVKTGIALGLTVLGAGIMVLAFVILFAGQLYGPEIAAEIGLEDAAATAFGLARWPVAFVMVLMAVAFMYWLAPNASLPFKWITPGAVFFAVVWAIASFGFGLYVSNFGSYNETYGALGGVVVLLVWFYLTAFLLLLGVEINQVLAEQAGDLPEESASTEPSWREREAHEKPAALPRSVGFAAAGAIWVAALVGLMRRKSG